MGMGDITLSRNSLYQTAFPHLHPLLTPVHRLDTLAFSLLMGSIWDSSISGIRVTHHIAHIPLLLIILLFILHVTIQGSHIASCNFQPLYGSHVFVPFRSHCVLLFARKAALVTIRGAWNAS
jgi:hypothetical protein